ncbi:hypothetical protein CROQUDRAFT_652424 [Cronartium quercuum f. sp. fusiforme G11]|uniref:Uncharacterized protein n=1 Tax=Cronartium quercuum f. sp. fusiforme G11 TaxID=708437 RepID=A0A9P6TFK6_9BASI|nr:hypothetical protein CROQUDRAFT_652424 [Cronartium quercuum f. sp. fusiforme G11]
MINSEQEPTIDLPQRKNLPHLDFGDQDLTDAFNDVRDGTHSSTSGLGHPRGSTPLSILSSRLSTPSNQLSADSSRSGNGIKALPNMSALLDFLETDNITSFATSLQPSLAPRNEADQQNQRLSPGPSLITHSPITANFSLNSTPSSQFPERRELTREATTPPYSPNAEPKSSQSKSLQLLNNEPHPTRRSSSQKSSSQNSTTPQPITRHNNVTISTPGRTLLSNRTRPNIDQPNSPRNRQFNQPNNSPRNKQTTINQTNRIRQTNNPISSSPRSLTGPETPSSPTILKPKPNITTAADRMAAALMEGAPDAHWCVPELGIRRSKVVEELLQPIRPSISVPNNSNPILEICETLEVDDNLNNLVLEEEEEDNEDVNKEYQSSNFITPARPKLQNQKKTSMTNKSTELNNNIQADDSLDQRVTELLSHIRADQIEKTHLALALADARSEVSALRDEVKLLRIGVERLTDDRLDSFKLKNHHHHNFDQQEDDQKQEQEKEFDLNQKISHPEFEKELNFIIPNHNNLRKKKTSKSEEQEQLSSELEINSKNPNSSSSSSIINPTKTFLSEIALSLTFTRTVDNLINEKLILSKNKNSIIKRSDDQIFNSNNLNDLIYRIKLWKHLARKKS